MSAKDSSHSFTDIEYALVVLRGIRRMVRKSDYYLAFIPARSLLDENASGSEVSAALDYAIAAMCEKLVADEQKHGEGR